MLLSISPAIVRQQFRHNWSLHLAALLSGAALPFAFAPYELRWLSFVSLSILFLVWRFGNARTVMLRGFLFGLGMFGVGVHWIYYSLHLFGDAIAPLAALITVGFVGLLAVYIALLGCLIAKFLAPEESQRKNPLWLALGLPAAWTLGELFRGWFLTGFPWLSVGYSQIDTWIAGYAPVLGVYGVSWVAATTSGLICVLIVGENKQRCIAIAGIVCIWMAGFSLGKIEWSQPAGDPLKIRMVQGNIEQHSKFMADLLLPSIERYKTLSESDAPVDLIIWPESAIPTFFYRIDEYLEDFTAGKLAQGTRVLTGGFTYDKATDQYYNSLRMLDDPQAYYHKKHLVPFGEYIPFRSVFAFLSQFITIPMSDLSPGTDSKNRIKIKGHLIAASICYEDAFGEELLDQFPQAGLLVNVSNDSWFGYSAAPYQHLEIARMRALETARPMLRVTNTGVSAAIDYRGKILALAGLAQASVLDVSVQPRSKNTFFMEVSNGLTLLGALAMLLIWQLIKYYFRPADGDSPS